MRNILAFFLLLTPLALFAENADSVFVVTHYTKKEVYIPMRDHKRLYTVIYEPKAAGRHPILITRTPYSSAPYGKAFKSYWNSYQLDYLKKNYIMVVQDVRGRYMSEGEYMDVRPYKANKTKEEIDEASDTYDTIDWLINFTKNNNGKVGVLGISYPGFYATQAALSHHPALKAVSPQAPVTEWFIGDDFHHNGAFMMMDAFGFYSGFGRPMLNPTTSGRAGYQFHTTDNYSFYLNVGSLADLSKLMKDSVWFWNDIYAHPNYDKFWQSRNTRSAVQHIPSGVATLVVGGLFDAEDCYGAWSLYKSIEQKARNNNKLVMGPWSHGGWSRGTGEFLGNVRFGSKTSELYQKQLEIPFFDHYLLRKGSEMGIAEATVFLTGSNKWKGFSQWPPVNSEATPLYLLKNGNMSYNRPTISSTVTDKEIEENMDNRIDYFISLYGSKEKLEKISGKTVKQIREEHREGIAGALMRDKTSFRMYTSDPAKPVPYTEDVHLGRTADYMTDDQRFAARRPDVLVYQTDTLTADVTLAGPVIADLFTSISTTDADFVVKLVDVFPDEFKYNDTLMKGNGKTYPMGGYQMLVRGEIMRGRYRNSFEKPEAFIPGAITEVKYALPDVAHVFKKGHRIMVQIQSSWFPLADRNPQQFIDIYHCSKEDFIPSDIRIYSDKDHPSRIILPILHK